MLLAIAIIGGAMTICRAHRPDTVIHDCLVRIAARIGRAANIVAKLCALSDAPIWITKAVYDSILDSARFSNGSIATGTIMWERALLDDDQ